MWIFALLIICIAIGLVLAVVISRMISKPIGDMARQAQRVSEGELHIRIDQNSTDEIGQLAASFNTMIDSLREVIGRVVTTSSQVSTAAAQLRSTSEQMATSTEEVVAQASTVATASEEMAATSGDIAQNCAMAANSSREANNAALAGAEVIQATVTGMNRISERVKSTAVTVEGLGTRSDQIGTIVGTIEDIADQTNLLALNAAIEAARAGEQGRGFAVVADEVRALAERTTRATKEISDMIKAIQSETRGAVVAMDEGVKEVARGMEDASRSGAALQEILDQINSVTTQVNQIATAAEEQTATTNQISSNILQINDVVQGSARGAQESASASAQLAILAEDLQAIVRRFHL
jgi:methyl-accepting chemotaxis protein